MVASGRTLSKSQKRELRSWLSRMHLDKNPELLLSRPEHAWAAWMDYQASKGIVVPAFSSPVASSKPVVASSDPVELSVLPRRSRGKGKVPAGELYSVRLPPDLLVALRNRAGREERPVSQIVRMALKSYLGIES